jgi:hypothetical protein
VLEQVVVDSEIAGHSYGSFSCSFFSGWDLLWMMKSMMGVCQSNSMTSISWPLTSTKSELVEGSSSSFTMGLLSAWTNTLAGTRAPLVQAWRGCLLRCYSP